MSVAFITTEQSRASAMREMIAAVAGELLLASPDTFSEVLSTALRRAGSEWRADRLSVFAFRPHEAEIIHEWHADGGTSLGAVYPAADLPAMWKHLAAGDTMMLNTRETAPPGWETEYAIMREIGVWIEYIAPLPAGSQPKWLISIEWDQNFSLDPAQLHGEVATLTHVLARALEANERASELGRMREHFKERQRLEAVGTMASGIAHDFNNVLQGVRSLADLAAEDDATMEETRGAISEIGEIADRAAELTRRLLLFSRQGAPKHDFVRVPKAAREVVTMLRRTLPEDRIVQLRCPDDAPPVSMSTADFDQVLINLCNNASLAMPQGGTITIDVHRVREERGESLLVRVADEGVGIGPEEREKVFQPFFTTRPAGEGTGLGLAIVRRVVEDAGGVVELQSALGEGTAVTLRLPTTEAPATTAAPAAVDVSKLGGTESVLLVEDDPFVRRVTRTKLERHGYRVTPCDDGQEAMDAVDRGGGPFDVVISDAIMPKRGGRSLFESLRAREPRLPFVFTTGYDAGTLADVRDEPRVQLLSKPYAATELLLKLRRVLEGQD